MKIKVNYFKLSPLIILIWGIYSFLFRDIIPVASGYGWDGVEYGKIALNFENLIGKMTSYRAGRIFPSVLIHYTLRFLNIHVNLKSVLIAFQIYGILILLIAAVFWVKIAERLTLNEIEKWIGFCALFINYPLLNLHFYYPVVTDSTAFLFGIVMIYSFITNNNILLIIIMLLSYFTWPIMIYIGLIFFIYSNVENNYWDKDIKKVKIILLTVILLFPFLLGFVLNIFKGQIKNIILIMGLDGKIFPKFIRPDLIKSFSFYELTNSILTLAYLFIVFWIIFSNFNISKFIKVHLKKRILVRIIISTGIIISLNYFKQLLYSPLLKPEVSLVRFIMNITSSIYPFQFLTCHISYYGPVLILLTIFYKDFVDYLKMNNLPVILIFIFFLMMSLTNESRVLINIYPIIVIYLIQSIDYSKIQNMKIFLFIFIATSLMLSKIWLIIKIPSTVYPERPCINLDKFPMQWLFMNLGPWQNFQMYIIHSIVAIIFFVLFYIIIKKSLKCISLKSN